MDKDTVELLRALAALPFVLVGAFCILILEFTNFCAIQIAGNIVIEEEDK